MNIAKKPRGRPKVSWDLYGSELQRRLETGKALETVEEEAEYLAGWGVSKLLPAAGESKKGPLKKERIRERIKKRHGGTEGYKQAREFHLMKLGGEK